MRCEAGGAGFDGTINTVGTTTFVYGTTTLNSYTNLGVTRVGSDGAPSTFTLAGGAAAEFGRAVHARLAEVE